MKKFIIQEELAQAILNYLGQQPYVSVHTMVPGLLALEVLPGSEVVNEAPQAEATPEAQSEAVTPEVVEA
jgi:hypothetical protein